MKKQVACFAMTGRQLVLLVRGGLLRWRLETYGLYMPSLPNARPWWRFNLRALGGLLRHGRAYDRWLREMRSLRGAGASEWWRTRLDNRVGPWAAYIEAESRGEAE